MQKKSFNCLQETLFKSGQNMREYFLLNVTQSS